MKTTFNMLKLNVFAILFVSLTLSMTVNGQGSMYKGARTWPTISSLMGQTVEKAKTILSSHGMVLSQSDLDSDSGIETHAFIPSTATDPEEELPYYLFSVNGKIVVVHTQFAYEDTGSSVELQDLEKVKNQLAGAGYTIESQNTETDSNPFGGESVTEAYVYKSNNSEARIYREGGMATFSLTLGATKYQQLLHGDGEE